jgi:hypothetical protein
MPRANDTYDWSDAKKLEILAAVSNQNTENVM